MATSNTNSTPHKGTLTGLQRYRQNIPKAAVAHKELGDDMVGYWYGPYGPTMFMDRLMPISSDTLKKLNPDVQFPLPVRQEGKKLEKHLYQYFVSIKCWTHYVYPLTLPPSPLTRGYVTQEETVKNYNLTPGCSFFIAANGKPKAGDPLSRPDGGIRENHGTLWPIF